MYSVTAWVNLNKIDQMSWKVINKISQIKAVWKNIPNNSFLVKLKTPSDY